uniref:Uncharacterized protein n=1 Tax=Cannabis sativa TaxID=3483 RepID=A0A803P4K0_CANSA
MVNARSFRLPDSIFLKSSFSLISRCKVGKPQNTPPQLDEDFDVQVDIDRVIDWIHNFWADFQNNLSFSTHKTMMDLNVDFNLSAVNIKENPIVSLGEGVASEEISADAGELE